MNFSQLISSLELGILYSLVAIAVYLTFRVTNFADLTADGSFPLGAAVFSVLIINHYHYVLALFAAACAGIIAGFVTGILNVRYRIIDILAGILTMTALYSINLRIMGQPNIALTNDFLPQNVGLVIIPVIAILIVLFLKTEIGLGLIAVGQNPALAESNGINIGRMKILALGLGNGLIALAGGLFALMQGFADISMGTGTIIIGLASVIIGEKLIAAKSIALTILGVILGSVCYRLFVTIALNVDFLKLEPSDLNLVSSLLVALTMIIPRFAIKAKKQI
jgi:putative ABC transport system permease protein